MHREDLLHHTLNTFSVYMALKLRTATGVISALLLASGCAASPAVPAPAPAELTELQGEFQVISEPTASGELLTAHGLVNEQHEWVLLSVEGLELPPSGSLVELTGRWVSRSRFEVETIERLPELKSLFTDPPTRPAQTHHNVMVLVAADVDMTEADRAD